MQNRDPPEIQECLLSTFKSKTRIQKASKLARGCWLHSGLTPAGLTFPASPEQNMLLKKLLHLNNHFPDQLSFKSCTRLEIPGKTNPLAFKVLVIKNQRNTSSQTAGLQSILSLYLCAELKQILHKACGQGEEHKGKRALFTTDADKQITGQAAHCSMKHWDCVTCFQTNDINSCRLPKTFLSSSF